MSKENINLEVIESFHLRAPHSDPSWGSPRIVSRVQNIVCCGNVMIFQSDTGLIAFDIKSGKYVCRAKFFSTSYEIEHVLKWNENTVIVGGNLRRFCLCSFCFVGNELKIDKNFTNLTNLITKGKCFRVLKINEKLFCFETKKQLEIVDYKSGKIVYSVSNHLEVADSFSRMVVSQKYENSFYFSNYLHNNSSCDVIKHVRFTDNNLLGKYGFDIDEKSQIFDLQLYNNKRDQEIIIVVVTHGIVMLLSKADGHKIPRETFKLGFTKDQYAGIAHILQNYLLIGTNESRLMIVDIENFSTTRSSFSSDFTFYTGKDHEDRTEELEIKEFNVSTSESRLMCKEVVHHFERDGQRVNYCKGGFLLVVSGENVTKIKVSGLKDSSFILGLEDLKERISFLFDLEGTTPDDIFFGSKDQKNLFFEIDCGWKFKCLRIFLL